MKTRRSTGEAIAALIQAHGGEAATARDRHLYREALQALVRLAKSELMMEMRSNVRKLAALPAPHTQNANRTDTSRQRQFEFHQDR